MSAQGGGTNEEKPPLELVFSVEGGFFGEPVELRLYSPGAVIYYTLDGSHPSNRAPVYNRPILIRSSTVVRAMAVKDKERSQVVGHTYFINEPETDFPVVSIGVAPQLLFDPKRGLFMQGGNVVDTLWQKPGANFWSRREVGCNVEIFETDKSCVYNSMTGFRLFGGMSRLFPQKSIALAARNRYGQKRFRHRIFGKDGPKDPKFLVLRNAGSDFGKAHFRDALMTGLLDGWDIDKQACRPALVYINGTFWGIYHIREKVNRYFIADHNEVDKDSIDLLEHRLTLKRGDRNHYLKLVRFMETRDLSIPANYAYVQTLMEVDNFMDYQIAQIFFDNQDAGGNIKFWRPRTASGRWRWILYDTDWGFGLQDDRAYRNNSLAFHTEPNGPSWPNPPWSTLFLRKLLENPEFEREFVNRFADYLNTNFEASHVEQRVEDWYQKLLPEMPRHLKRWNLSRRKWERQVNVVRAFARERTTYMRLHLMERFNTGGVRNLAVSVAGGGTVFINNRVEIREKHDFEGKYFENIPVEIKAVPDYGYRFVGWEGLDLGNEVREVNLRLTDKEYRVKAVFEKYVHPLVGKVMINEISANNKKSGDWIELFNYSEKKVALDGWILTDRNRNEFTLPNVSMDPNDYLVICQDSAKFMREFPQAYNFIGGLNFGINKRREALALFSRLGASVDSVYYEVPPTDSVFTFSLLLPHLDNSDPENWELRPGPGSPNAPNPYYVESRIRLQQEYWMQIGLAAGVFMLSLLLLALRRRGVL